jgi:hypothetical protein
MADSSLLIHSELTDTVFVVVNRENLQRSMNCRQKVNGKNYLKKTKTEIIIIL